MPVLGLMQAAHCFALRPPMLPTQGYPGNLHISVTYRLSKTKNELTCVIKATTDTATPSECSCWHKGDGLVAMHGSNMRGQPHAAAGGHERERMGTHTIWAQELSQAEDRVHAKTWGSIQDDILEVLQAATTSAWLPRAPGVVPAEMTPTHVFIMMLEHRIHRGLSWPASILERTCQCCHTSPSCLAEALHVMQLLNCNDTWWSFTLPGI